MMPTSRPISLLIRRIDARFIAVIIVNSFSAMPDLSVAGPRVPMILVLRMGAVIVDRGSWIGKSNLGGSIPESRSPIHL